MASQRSHETVIGRFQNAVSLLNGVAEYNPNDSSITIRSLQQLISNIINQNRVVDTAQANLGAKREIRRQAAYKIKDENPDCLENRLTSVLFYLKGDLSDEKASIKQITSILKRMNPVYAKKDPVNPLPRGAGKSPSEKSFTSLIGNARSIIAVIETLPSYRPSNKKITVDELRTTANQLEQLNIEAAQLLEDYGSAVNKREELYEGKEGLTESRGLVKNYLAGLGGGRKNEHYLAFSDALKGM